MILPSCRLSSVINEGSSFSCLRDRRSKTLEGFKISFSLIKVDNKGLSSHDDSPRVVSSILSGTCRSQREFD